MIINIRGTNGSGKTWVVKQVLDRFGGKPRYGGFGPRRPEAYELLGAASGWYILGSYGFGQWGLDAWKEYDRVVALIRRYVPRGNLLFEGLIISGNIGRVGEILAQHDGVALFLSTPLEVCLDRVEMRRIANQLDASSYDPERKLIPKYREIERCRERMLEAGLVRVEVGSDDPVADVVRLMEEAR